MATKKKSKTSKSSGRQQIVLRLKKDVNRAVRAAAKADGLSINSYVEGTFRRKLRIPKAV